MKPRLFLLKPDFTDASPGDNTVKYFCPDCVFIEGMLSYYPRLREEIAVQYVDFQRPRAQLIEALGEDFQSCPSLIMEEDLADSNLAQQFKRYKNKLFSNEVKRIVRYFSYAFGTGIPHP
jgi:hypothetical protein